MKYAVKIPYEGTIKIMIDAADAQTAITEALAHFDLWEISLAPGGTGQPSVTPVNDFYVTWTVDVAASSPREAAEIVRANFSEAPEHLQFSVEDDNEESVAVDLSMSAEEQAAREEIHRLGWLQTPSQNQFGKGTYIEILAAIRGMKS